MSVTDVVLIIFSSMTFIVTLIKLMIYIADKFSNNAYLSRPLCDCSFYYYTKTLLLMQGDF